MKKVHSLKFYLLEKCLIGNGIINGILNAIIFYFMEKGHTDKIFNTFDIVIDLSITSLILGMILALVVLPLTNKDVESGKVLAVYEENKIANFIPDEKKKASFIIGLVTMGVVAVVSLISVVVFKLSPLTVNQMMIFKGIMCAVAGMVAGYMSIIKTVYKKESQVEYTSMAA